MFLSYLNKEIRNCCLLLRPAHLNSNFSSSEIKIIRTIIADLKAAPKLTDSPVNYNYIIEEGIIEIFYDCFKIISEVNSSYITPKENQIERIKIIAIININLQIDPAKEQISN